MDSRMFVSIIGCLFTHYCSEKSKLLELEDKEKVKINIKYYVCRKCGKILVLVNDTNVPTVCCGEVMSELKPGTTDGAAEKHVPILRLSGNNAVVTVGETLHPMTEDHFIMWIALMTDKGIQKKFLCPGDIPSASFMLMDDERIIGAYAYCNLHQLWRSA